MTLQNTLLHYLYCQILPSVSLVTPQNFPRLAMPVCFLHSALHPVHICGTDSKHLKKADYVLYMPRVIRKIDKSKSMLIELQYTQVQKLG